MLELGQEIAGPFVAGGPESVRLYVVQRQPLVHEDLDGPLEEIEADERLAASQVNAVNGAAATA